MKSGSFKNRIFGLQYWFSWWNLCLRYLSWLSTFHSSKNFQIYIDKKAKFCLKTLPVFSGIFLDMIYEKTTFSLEITFPSFCC